MGLDGVRGLDSRFVHDIQHAVRVLLEHYPPLGKTLETCKTGKKFLENIFIVHTQNIYCRDQLGQSRFGSSISWLFLGMEKLISFKHTFIIITLQIQNAPRVEERERVGGALASRYACPGKYIYLQITKNN